MGVAPVTSYPERIATGLVAPWVGEDVAGCLASASAAQDELDTLARDDRRRDDIAAQRDAWKTAADVLARGQEQRP